MTVTHAGPEFSDNSLDGSLFATILRRRRKWILLGTVLGLVLSVAYLLLTPPTYTATARVNITALGSEPVPEGRAVSSLVDIPTERQLAASALTTEGAARDLGAGWRASDIGSGLSVSGDPSSSVLGVSYAASDRERAILGADAVARAYLEVRGTLVSERAEAMVESIDERIAQYEQERRELVRSSPAGDVATAVRIDTIDAGVLALQQRRATWSDVSTRAGEIITPASSAEVSTSPVLWRVIALGLLGGLFAGVVMAAVRHRVDRVASHADDVRDLLGVDLLRPQGPYGDTRRWDAAATIA
ncbi:Wzz/FepE/Etk N-terminal domain-containing protein, partial [Corynebacterium nasicanis]